MRPGRRPTRSRRLPRAQLPLRQAAPALRRLDAASSSTDASTSTGPAAGTRYARLTTSCWSSAIPLLAVTGETASSIGVAPPWMLLAATVVGLPVALWSYKCAMMIIFQRSILYMGAWPPGARSTAVDPSDPVCRGLDVRNVEIAGGDPGITLRGVELRRQQPAVGPPALAASDRLSPCAAVPDGQSTVVVYFQGNMGSPVARLPLFAHLLTSTLSPFPLGRTTLLAIPPRSYYLSTNARPTQAGLTRDYRAVLQHAQQAFPRACIVVYGHSLGGTAACCMLSDDDQGTAALAIPPDALVLENAFPSVPTMVARSLYRSRWLPYHFLTPFVRDRWDAYEALRAPGELLARTPVLFVSGETDSLVRPELAREMFDAASASARGADGGEDKGGGGASGHARREWLSIPEASHDDTWARKGPWGRGVRAFLDRIERDRASR